MRIAVLGTGYVGLVAGAGFAERGHHVVCMDRDADRVARLRRGEVPIHEPGLGELLDKNRGRLAFTDKLGEAVAGAEVVVIAVGTPDRRCGDGAELGPVLEVAAAIGGALTGFAVVAVKSTVPVGTTERIRTIIAAAAVHECAVAANPEFLREGHAVADFMNPARVIVGCDDDRGIEVLRALYRPFVSEERFLIMDPPSAELGKYAANAMLATRISFMNELALLAGQLGADIDQVRRGIGSDPRIGPEHLAPGPGFGGGCLPKDLRALARCARDRGVDMAVIAAVEAANERQKRFLGARVCAHFGGADLGGRRIAVWGLSFKPGTDDLRESPAVAVIEDLLRAGARVIGHDPVAMPAARALLRDRIDFARDMYLAAEGCDALVLATEWELFRRPDFARLMSEMRSPVLFDGRNLWDPKPLRALGFTYHGIGR